MIRGRKILTLAACALTFALAFFANVSAEATDMEVTVIEGHGLNDFNSNTDIKEAKSVIYDSYLKKIKNRKNELSDGVITIDGESMKLVMQVIGEPDKNGYPVYIALHGGSSGNPDIEDEQFEIMTYESYNRSIHSGIYITTRALTNDFDQHYRPKSFTFYDRIIEDAVAFYQGDPNRVYLLGFSSGGDGVYAITPKIADRLAAANTSAGFPHIHLLENLYQLPFCIQVGEKDDDYKRNIHAAEIDNRLNQLQKMYSGGFKHDTYIHVNGGHNEGWNDDIDSKKQEVIKQSDLKEWMKNSKSAGTEYANTNAVDWVSQYTRTPLPTKLVWNTGEYAGMRSSQRFYWLDRDGYLKNTIVTASYDKKKNKVSIKRCDAKKGTLKILLSPDMVDVFNDIQLEILGQTVTVRPVVSKQIMENTLASSGDSNYIFTSEIDITFDDSHKKITVNSKAVNQTDYSVEGAENLIYWDENNLFYVDQSLLGLNYNQLCEKLNMDLPQLEECDWKQENTFYTYTVDPDFPSICFFFQKGICYEIYNEQDGSASKELKEAFRSKFGALFTEDNMPSSNTGSADTFGNGGMSWHWLRNNRFNNMDHIQQGYALN